MEKRILIFLGVIICLGLLSIFYPYLTGEKEIVKEEYEKEECFVNRIIDGDTLVCNNETIRLLGIDTPEKNEEYFQEAKDYLSEVNNKNVLVLRDFDDKGKYYRKLRYIFYQGRLINVELVEQGLAKAYYHEDLKYEQKFLDAEKFAKENCLIIWESYGECK
jgi:micrococcal nuclease